MFDTIAAISSGNINQAISIIRISGPDAIEIIKKIFTGKIGKDKTIEYGFIKDQNGNIVDEVLVNFFIGKNNFIGEDTVEINAHGGVVVTNKILDLVLANGARLAQNGEFSRRAFLNKKISLAKAEAINDLIHAKTSKQQKMAINSFNGEKEKLIDKFIKNIEYLIGLCEVNIDYPEYDDVPILDNENFKNHFYEIYNELEKIVKIAEANQVFIKSLSVVIIGKPNVGKSTLMNAILNEEKSIVTNIPGTTRDVVETEVIFNNYILKFKDTAGIRETNELIEKIGIEKAWKELENADVILHVIDSTKRMDQFDREIEAKAKNKKYIQLWNKADLINEKDPNKIYINSLKKEIKKLEDELNKIFAIESFDEKINFNNRQVACLKRGFLALKNCKNSMENNLTYDVLIVDLHECWEALKSISGTINKEDLLDSIFKNFCVGK